VKDLSGPLVFTPDGQWLVIGTGRAYEFRKVAAWGQGRSVPLEETGGVHRPIAFSPTDGRTMAVAADAGVARLADVETGQQLVTLKAPRSGILHKLTFSPDGTRLAVATESHFIQLWDLPLLREGLARSGLDWDRPSPPRRESPAALPPRLDVLPGEPAPR
jgi:WD40 repeat protein